MRSLIIDLNIVTALIYASIGFWSGTCLHLFAALLLWLGEDKYDTE